MAAEITLADQRALLLANLAAAQAGQSPVAVERIIDVTVSELRAAGLTAVDAVIGYAKEKPIASAGMAVGFLALIGIAYFMLKGRS